MEFDHVLARLWLERSYIVSSLKSRGLRNEQRNGIKSEKENKDRVISGLVQ